MRRLVTEMTISAGAAYILFTHLTIQAGPSEPTLQDWVGKHEAYPVTEALVSDPAVDKSVREQARRLYSVASVEIMIGGDPVGLDSEALPLSHFSGRNLSTAIEVPEQPEAMWMLERVWKKPRNSDAVFTCYHNGMLKDLPVGGRVRFTFDVVDRHARILQRKIDGEHLDDIADCVEEHLAGMEVAAGINELVSIELTYGEET